MREVVIIGVGMHRFGRFPEKGFTEMATEAIVNALKDAGVEWKKIQALYAAHSYQHTGAANKVAGILGATGIPVYNVELGCSGGSAVVGMGYQAIAAGLHDVVCAVGFEKMPRGILPADEFPEWLRDAGIAMYPNLYAWAALRYMREYGITREQLAKVCIKSHNNASLFPYAHYRDCAGWTTEQVLNQRMIIDPLTVVQIAPVSEGAAAAILCAKDVAPKFKEGKSITIAAYAQRSGMFSRPYSALSFIEAGSLATKACVQEVYETAGCGPEDLDIIQCHDAYTIAEMLDYEDLGLCAVGECGRLVDEGATELSGRIPVNTDGGMMSRGNVIGACALASICETVWQLRGEAGDRQVKGAKIGLSFSLGIGPNVNATILKR